MVKRVKVYGIMLMDLDGGTVKEFVDKDCTGFVMFDYADPNREDNPDILLFKTKEAAEKRIKKLKREWDDLKDDDGVESMMVVAKEITMEI